MKVSDGKLTHEYLTYFEISGSHSTAVGATSAAYGVLVSKVESLAEYAGRVYEEGGLSGNVIALSGGFFL
jgi:hypothetical protein